ncbi:MAG: TraI domain-containing protein, partial [Gammaproteobacteria bacterium]|nr:TraI domain-containing protein [Gammaproteobacteria bacterium]
MSLFKFFKSKKESQSISELALDYDNLPVMTADELIKFTEQQNRIRRIKRIIKMDDERFKILYLDVIYRFAELVQLMPASQAHHHAVPGGLFIHTLEVIEYAMNIRQQYKLPAFAEQEVQERERHVWTYAIFVAALLHDVGKRVTMCDFMVDGKIYSAFEDRFLSETGYKNYKIVFNNPKYHHLHDQIGLTFSDLLPELGRKFIFSHLNIVKEMSAYIHNDKFNSGMIGEIISQADQRSTGESLAHTPTRKFKGATLENVGERLMTQLRLMIASNDFVINKPNANIYTSENGFTYCVSKVIVDAIREHLQKNNETDIPTDNNRIFDIFQEYGFAE